MKNRHPRPLILKGQIQDFPPERANGKQVIVFDAEQPTFTRVRLPRKLKSG